MSRAKGNRTVQKAVAYYEADGWLVDKVEKTGKWVFDKDLYSLFDLVGVKRNTVIFIQVKTNQPATQEPYKRFADDYSGTNLLVECYTWYDRRGAVIHKFLSNDVVERLDLRK